MHDQQLLTGTLQSMQVGTPQRYHRALLPDEREWRTSFFRTPSAAPRFLFATHLEGNAQADTDHHGGPGQAVLLYAAAHYEQWHEEYPDHSFGPGGFGENFTVAGLSEATVCIGDRFSIGDAVVQVSGPRYPCWKIEERWRLPGLTARAAATGRTGWYCSVVREGLVQAGQEVRLLERPYPRWSVALTNDFGHGRAHDAALGTALASCPLLVPWWQQLIEQQLSRSRA